MPSPKLSNVSSAYGAPMGRREHAGNAANAPTRVRLFRVYLDSGGYDSGGAYWGIGKPLYCATDGDDFETYLRAPDRDTAKRRLLARFPLLKFYR